MRIFVRHFFSIAVREEDRPYLRFVWPDEKNDMVTWWLTGLSFGVNCSPFVMCVVLRYHLEQAIQAASEESLKALLSLLQDSFYVDDCVSMFRKGGREL